MEEEGEMDDNWFPFAVVTVKAEDEEIPQLSELHPITTEDHIEPDAAARSSAAQMHSKLHSDGDQQLLAINRAAPSLLQVSSSDQLNSELIRIKKEEEELWIVDEEKPNLSGLHRIKPEDKRETEAPPISSAEQMETEPGSEDSEGPEPNDTDLKLLTITQTEGEHSSHLCDGFNEKGSLQTQETVQTQKRIYACDICGKRFQRRETLKNHMRIHPTERQFICSVCSKAFSRQDHLKSHMRVHTGEKPFLCTVCSKGFSQQIHLKSHMRVHTGEKPFVCSFCGKGFSRQDLLKSHIRVHTGEKPFVCNVCSKGFSQQNHLKNHMGFHTATFSCNDCDKRFVKEDQLKRHVRLHTEGRPFGCNVCKSRFYKRYHLENHMRIHSGEKPFVCTVCSKAFSRDGDLKRHMIAHEGGN
ncbi:gastrula zinc finger protein XlCGF57.1-like [Cyprinodon tularosa]|uniref:gastrula zinc finger protein XlCGF57.1-like n=1 Tax=Cyprinodon tularosa TaxID=77115 RepID=UPI0018E26DFA|nr:gastrula zinc finger protein XlCGF57.1-like [Cyprinodon tularosa]